MLEIWKDPQSPYAKSVFQVDKKCIFHCAGGLRSALAAKTAQDMGLKPVAHIGGGFAAWRDAGGPVEKFGPKKPKGWVGTTAGILRGPQRLAPHDSVCFRHPQPPAPSEGPAGREKQAEDR